MKNIINLSILLLIHFSTFSQKTLRYEDLSKESFVPMIKNNQVFDKYIDSKGLEYSKGKKIVIGSPSNPDNISTDLWDDPKYGNFTFIRKSRAFVMTAELMFKGEECIIEEIFAEHIGFGKKSPLKVSFICKLNGQVNHITTLTIENIDKALGLGEIINPKEPLSREAAILKLKESKELLDLELISKEDYEKIKLELGVIIMRNNS
jgi:hypothetical protein